MYISRMMLNKSTVFKEIFASGYALHQAVWNLFTDGPDRNRDFLYRLDAVGKMPLVYAVSARKPQDVKNVWHIETKDYSPQIKTGMRLGFSVRVNPVRKKEGKRHDVVMDEKYKIRKYIVGDQKQKKQTQEIITEACGRWIEERAQRHGFNILKNGEGELTFRADDYQQVLFHKAKGGNAVQYSTIDITGTLEVINEQSFTTMLLCGFGPAKGFGCGLMLARRL